jgi:phosphonoacetate hydrolase
MHGVGEDEAAVGIAAGPGGPAGPAGPGPRPAAYRRPHDGDVARLADGLLAPALEPIVEFVVTADDEAYEVRAVDGRVRFARTAEGAGWRFDDLEVEGRNPLGNTATDRFSPLDDELSHHWPDRTEQAYPHAHEQIAQLFDHPAAPDLVCLHTAAHNWQDQGGERGEHGSLGIVQARAPFVLAGAGVKRQGVIPRSCRLVDVAPTVLALLGAEPAAGSDGGGAGVGPNGAVLEGALLNRQDGQVLDDLLDPSAPGPDHVVGFLWDGTNANVLYDMVAQGEAPNVARLLEMGVALGHGAMASLPSVTLANHTTILTGAHPGHHGILHNAWYDKASGQQVITNSPATWPWAMQTLSPAVETIHQAVHRNWPGAFTVSVNEPCDSGADHSIFDQVRRGEGLPRPPRADELPFATERFVRPEKGYEIASRIDHTGMTQAVEAWTAGHSGNGLLGTRLPRFCFVNFTLTDAAFHHSGPYADIARSSIHDSDARLGRILDAIERAGAWDRTAFFLVADHGMEDSNPEVTGNWAPALDATDVPYRDEAYGFIYATR